MALLGSRLETALNILKVCENRALFADIGCDHAFFAIEAVKRGIAQGAIAADINRMPLEKGRENAERADVSVEFILSDGFDALEDKGITVAAVCGMGGELIAGMVKRSGVAHRCDLILQPMSAPEELRRALWERGFSVYSETFAFDSGKPYVIIHTKFSGEKSEFSYSDLYLGKERPQSEAFFEYCKKTAIAAEKRRLGYIARGDDTKEIDELIDYCIKRKQ